MLLLSEKVSAQDAYDWGLVTHLLPAGVEFTKQAAAILDDLLSLPPQVPAVIIYYYVL